MDPREFECVSPFAASFKARWSDRQKMVSMEETVEVVRRGSDNWVVISPTGICEQTQVYLTGLNYTGNGIVNSCKKDGSLYTLKIAMAADDIFYPLRHEFDPGVLGIDNFLTEEEEAKILESFNDEIPYSGGVVHRSLAGWILSLILTIRQRVLILLTPSFCC